MELTAGNEGEDGKKKNRRAPGGIEKRFVVGPLSSRRLIYSTHPSIGGLVET